MFIIGFALGRILKLSKTKVDDDKETLKAIDSIRNDPNDNEWRKA